jgi:hypothetical protein
MLIDDAGLSARIGADHFGHPKGFHDPGPIHIPRISTQLADLLDRTVTDINDQLSLTVTFTHDAQRVPSPQAAYTFCDRSTAMYCSGNDEDRNSLRLDLAAPPEVWNFVRELHHRACCLELR